MNDFRFFRSALPSLSALWLVACAGIDPAGSSPSITPPGGDGDEHVGNAGDGDSQGDGDGDGEGDAGDGLDDFGPFPGTPVEPSPLTDQSRNLEDILEHGTLSADDCASYFGGQQDRETTLRCGKWMFFYGHNEVPGSPAELVDLLRENAPDTVGTSLEQFGLFADPYSDRNLPVGLSDGPDMVGGVSTYTLTCGSCHFGKTTDGRYVVGSPNHAFYFGRFTLAVSSLPGLAADTGQELAPEVESVLGPIRDEVFGNPFTALSVLAEAVALLPNLLVTQVTPPDDAAKLALAILPSGVMDPYSPPSLDDGVKVPVRMSPLWGIDPEAMTKAGSTHGAMLGSNGGAPDLEHILRTFSFIAGQIRKLPLGEDYDPENVRPLITYIMSLTPPEPEKALDEAKVAAGKQLFHDNCYRCHNGPGFAGTRVFTPEEIGTDPNIADLVDPEHDGSAIYDVITPAEITGGLRARRLSAVWSLSRLFHNGSAHSLPDVFCLDGPRVDSGLGSGFSTAGHMFPCDLPSRDAKLNVIEFLESL
jgi:hypothetical protein